MRKVFVLIALLLFSVTAYAGHASAADWATVLKGSERSIPRLEILDAANESGICSAVVINATAGFALTAAHCVSDERDTVTLNGRHAKFVKANKILDLAVLRFDQKHERALPLAPEAPEAGAEAAILGYPFGSETYHVQAGIVSAPYDRDCRCLKLNVDVIPGDSGGAVVDGQGRLIGLTTSMYYNGAAHLTGAVPLDAIRDFVEQYLPK